jgi:hypothetical protein
MKKANKDDLFWFIHDTCQKEIIPQADLAKDNDYSRGWVDACNKILKYVESLKVDE